MDQARYVILADGAFNEHDAKTACCLIRYRPREVVAVVDEASAGRTVQDVLGFGGAIPVVADYRQAASLGPNRLLIGIAPAGGRLPEQWRRTVRTALAAGVDVYSGLHVFLSEDPEFDRAARDGGARIVELRAPPAELVMPSGARDRLDAPVVLTVGSDCNAGKMTVTWELHAAARKRGLDYGLLPTGQTGILLHGGGIAVDRIISDFVAGVVEQATVEAAEGRSLVLVEGQGSLVHPFYSAVTLGLLHGCRPDAMILCHVAHRKGLRHREHVPIPPLGRLVRIYEEAASWVRPARVIGLALATHRLDDSTARRMLAEARQETGLPVEDVIRYPSGDLLAACEALRSA